MVKVGVEPVAKKYSTTVLTASQARAEDWKAIQETMHLLPIPGMRKSIREAMAGPLPKSAKDLRW